MGAVRKTKINMQSQFDLEMQRALSQLALDTLDLVTLRRMCATAEEWYDGSNSPMKRFSKGRGLPTGFDYYEMSSEAIIALKEISASSPHRRQLEELRDFGQKMWDAERNLRAIAKNTEALIAAGMADQYVTGMVALAAGHVRQARGKTTAPQRD